jgi:hypothetical protein|tara:strand:+ start:619 stop:831 length:213 start_codon:yes stop_codon:yes gene_type:complete
MKKMSEGDLVYVPSSVMLYTNDEQGAVQKIMKLNKPASLLVMTVKDRAYEVLYEGEKWLVDKNKTYEATL